MSASRNSDQEFLFSNASTASSIISPPRKNASLQRRLFPPACGPIRTVILPNSSFASSQIDEKQFTRVEAIINSMTPKERRNHEIISGTRRKRIAAGSGTSVQDVNQLLRQYAQMSKMFKSMGKGGLAKNLLRGGLSNMGAKQRFGR